MKLFTIFTVAFIAVFAASIKMYGDSYIPAPNYYCVYFDSLERCYSGEGTACYGIDEDCNWLNIPDVPEEQPE